MAEPNINALCVSIVMGWPPPPPGMTTIRKSKDIEWPSWLEPYLTPTTITDEKGTTYGFKVLELNKVPIKVCLANVPSPAQLMLLLERVLFLKEHGIAKASLSKWGEITRSRIVHFKLRDAFDDNDSKACRACEVLLQRIEDRALVVAES